MKTPTIDLLVTIIDNYGDMGTACELIIALKSEYGDQYTYVIWTNHVDRMAKFVISSGIGDIAIEDIRSFSEIRMLRKSAIVISILHSPIPDLDLFAPHALILRLDYISLDPLWLIYNESEHIASTADRQIIEIIPSPLEGGAGLIPHWLNSRSKEDPTSQKHITIFAYPSTLNSIDWDSFPEDLVVYVFGSIEYQKKNIICLEFVPTDAFHKLLDTSEFAIIRGDTTFAYMIQGLVPFFWDMYRGLGGFPIEQSESYLSLIGASDSYRSVHEILNGQKVGKISYTDLTKALTGTEFPPICTKNLIHTMKKHIDRFENSI